MRTIPIGIKKSEEHIAARKTPEFVQKMLSCPTKAHQMTPASSLLAHICLLNSVVERAGDRRAIAHGLTMTQWFALGCVGHAEKEGVTHSELGQRLMLSKAPITGVVDRLERNGYVTREADIHDRRISRIKITLKGEEVWEAVRIELRILSSEICEGFSDTELLEAQNLLERLLEKSASMDPTLAGEKN